MKIRVLKSKTGILSGVVIPMEDIDQIKSSVKSDSEFYKILDDLLDEQKSEALKKRTILASGLTAAEAEEEAQKITDKIYADAFKKGIPMFYRDARTEAPTQFIRANPDGSEDLVSYDLNKDDYTVLKNLVSAGKGYWSYLIPRK